jgi:hypothetical protein
MSDSEVITAFFEPREQMQRSIALLCESHPPHHADPVTHTLIAMITCPLQVQLTAVGWQPFKGKELTIPYQRMTSEQKEALKTLLQQEGAATWTVYEYATVYRCKARGGKGACLSPLAVLEAVCGMVLKSAAYPDRRMRVAVCNIVLQRVQASIPVDKNTLRELNTRLFAPAKAEDLTCPQPLN